MGEKRILLARLAADLELLQTRRQAEREALRAKWREKNRQRAGQERAVHGAAASVAGRDVAARERELARTRAGLPCPCCGRAIGRNGGCWQSAGCIDATMILVLPAWNPARLYSSAA